MLKKISAWIGIKIYNFGDFLCDINPDLKMVIELTDYDFKVKYVNPNEYTDGNTKRSWDKYMYKNGNIYYKDSVTPLKIFNNKGGYRTSEMYKIFMKNHLFTEMYNEIEKEDWLMKMLPIIGGIILLTIILWRFLL